MRAIVLFSSDYAHNVMVKLCLEIGKVIEEGLASLLARSITRATELKGGFHLNLNEI